MAKNHNEGFEPVISQIPVPQSDSPLVIDLPDGQKLVVGNLSSGTVIEVATWRGTGRPDSRTQRLMLGVSGTPEVNNSQAEYPQSEYPNSESEVVESPHSSQERDYLSEPTKSSQRGDLMSETIDSAHQSETKTAAIKKVSDEKAVSKKPSVTEVIVGALATLSFPFINAFLPRSKQLRKKQRGNQRSFTISPAQRASALKNPSLLPHQTSAGAKPKVEPSPFLSQNRDQSELIENRNSFPQEYLRQGESAAGEEPITGANALRHIEVQAEIGREFAKRRKSKKLDSEEK